MPTEKAEQKSWRLGQEPRLFISPGPNRWATRRNRVLNISCSFGVSCQLSKRKTPGLALVSEYHCPSVQTSYRHQGVSEVQGCTLLFVAIDQEAAYRLCHSKGTTTCDRYQCPGTLQARYLAQSCDTLDTTADLPGELPHTDCSTEGRCTMLQNGTHRKIMMELQRAAALYGVSPNQYWGEGKLPKGEHTSGLLPRHKASRHAQYPSSTVLRSENPFHTIAGPARGDTVAGNCRTLCFPCDCETVAGGCASLDAEHPPETRMDQADGEITRDIR